MGWRYLYLTIAGLTITVWFIRFFFIKVHESPKYYLAQGKDAEAVSVIDAIAKQNGKENIVTVHKLAEIEAEVRLRLGMPPKVETGEEDMAKANSTSTLTVTVDLFKKSASVFSGKRVKSLFEGRKRAFSTAMVMLLWMTLCKPHSVLQWHFGTSLTPEFWYSSFLEHVQSLSPHLHRSTRYRSWQTFSEHHVP